VHHAFGVALLDELEAGFSRVCLLPRGTLWGWVWHLQLRRWSRIQPIPRRDTFIEGSALLEAHPLIEPVGAFALRCWRMLRTATAGFFGCKFCTPNSELEFHRCVEVCDRQGPIALRLSQSASRTYRFCWPLSAPPLRGRGAKRRGTLPVRLQRAEEGEMAHTWGMFTPTFQLLHLQPSSFGS
jgi:hypothetical protein